MQEEILKNMRKKFKKMNISQKKCYEKEEELDIQKAQYRRDNEELQRIIDDKKDPNISLQSDSNLDEKGGAI